MSSRIILVGHSLGGMAAISAAYAGRLPKEVLSLVLVDTSAGNICDHGVLRALPSTITNRLPEIAQAHPRTFDALWAAVRPALSPWLGAPAKSGATRPSARTLATILASLREWDVTDQLHRIELPTSIVVGNLDAITPPAHSVRLATGISDSSLTTAAGTHNLMTETLGAKACARVITAAVIEAGSTAANTDAAATTNSRKGRAA